MSFFSLPPWLRNTLALLVIAVGAICTYIGWRGHNALVQPQPDGSALVGDAPGSAGMLRFGVIADLVGCVLFLMSGKTMEERNGY